MILFNYNKWISYMIFCLIIVAGILVHSALWNVNQEIEREDIYYTFIEGGRLINGANPYERVLSGDMRTNNKYATYFPMFYLLSGYSQQLGLESFPEWLSFWRVIFLVCNLGISCLIFQICAAENKHLLGIIGVFFWLFNRWTLHVSVISHIDFLPLFILLLSLSLLPRYFYLSCILLGLSLAIKQIAIFVVPVYLIWSWNNYHHNRLQNTLAAFALIAAIPLLVSIPFLIWNAEGYCKSILFSVTRYPPGYLKTQSLDTLAGVYGIPAKIPMLFLLVLSYSLVFLQGIPLYVSHLLVMIIFFNFNSVVFRQYAIWFLPFIPLALSEIVPGGIGGNQVTRK
jgi:uncharacterized membrane protein